jgi:hypothetical protein
MICRVTVEELAAFDWTLARDGELERDFGHWSHWRPSSRLRIRLTARTPSPTAAAAGKTPLFDQFAGSGAEHKTIEPPDGRERTSSMPPTIPAR